MYDELIKTLRLRAALWEKMYDEDNVLKQAADAIEELSKDLERSKEWESFWEKEANEALKKFQLAVASKPRWIPVTERLPDDLLDELDPNAGRMSEEIMEDCSIFCQLALD